jgi:hypothetical protein
MDHPHHSTPYDFWSFPTFKSALEGRRFADIPDSQRNVATLLQTIQENDSRDFPAVAPSSHVSLGEYIQDDSRR